LTAVAPAGTFLTRPGPRVVGWDPEGSAMRILVTAARKYGGIKGDRRNDRCLALLERAARDRRRARLSKGEP